MKKWLFTILFLLFWTSIIGMVNGMNDPVSLTLTTDKTVYQTSEPVAMSLVVLNQTSTAVKANFSSSQEYDFILYGGEQIIWKWSGGKMFTQSLKTVTLSPEQPLIYLTVFNPATAKKVLPAGKYKLEAVWNVMNKTYTSLPQWIEVRNES
jgi:hypothetical protein